MGSTLPGLIFVGISAPFKQHNVINGSEKERQRIPQRLQEIVVMVSSAGSLDLKSIYASDKEEFQIEKCNFGILSVPVTSIASRRPRSDTDRPGRVALSRLSALLKTPCWKPLYALNPITPPWLNLQQWALHNSLLPVNQRGCVQRPLRCHYSQFLNCRRRTQVVGVRSVRTQRSYQQ